MNERATPAETVDATRRTRLASERTELAWWRTGLTALAVALAVGRVIPSLDPNSAQWPYDIAGICFALYGLVAVGTALQPFGTQSMQAFGQPPAQIPACASNALGSCLG
jgi:uncharacterized membrane protein YidH (DUF202 family)